MILEQLVEVKDVNAYIEFRQQRLERDLRDISRYPLKSRATIQRMHEARIKELRLLKQVIARRELKKKSKEYWRDAAESET